MIIAGYANTVRYQEGSNREWGCPVTIFILSILYILLITAIIGLNGRKAKKEQNNKTTKSKR
jgi:hypothetical protein